MWHGGSSILMSLAFDLCNTIFLGAYSAEQPLFGPLMTSTGVLSVAAPSLEVAVHPLVRLMDESCRSRP